MDGNLSKPLERLAREFEELLELELRLTPEFVDQAERLAAYLAKQRLLPWKQRCRAFLAHVNWKFRINSDGLQAFYARAAGHGYTFNYHEKKAIQQAFDLQASGQLRKVLDNASVSTDTKRLLLDDFHPATDDQTIAHLRAECGSPSRLRKAIGDRDIALEILQAQFAAFLFCSLPTPEMHRYFDPAFAESPYKACFWEQLLTRSPELFNRNHALDVLLVEERCLESEGDAHLLRDALLAFLAQSFASLNNHGYAALLLRPLLLGDRSYQWELAADLTLFGEKHRETRLDKAYFRPTQIEAATRAYIPGIDRGSAQFDIANEGFIFKDCTVDPRNWTSG